MSRVYHREARPRWSVRKIVGAVLGIIVVLPLLGAGAIAIIHLTQLDSPHPLLRLVTVEGDSMLPTFHAGQQLVFVRKPWHKGSIVIADVGEPAPVVKRVWGGTQDDVIITGDNQQITATYSVSPDKIIATFCCRTGLTFAPPQLRGKPARAGENLAP
jgi:signal peptidase I